MWSGPLHYLRSDRQHRWVAETLGGGHNMGREAPVRGTMVGVAHDRDRGLWNPHRIDSPAKFRYVFD